MSRVDAVKAAVMKGGDALTGRSRRPTRSSRSATAWTRSPQRARPRSCSPAGRCATPKSSPPPTSTASRWSSPVADTSGTETWGLTLFHRSGPPGARGRPDLWHLEAGICGKRVRPRASCPRLRRVLCGAGRQLHLGCERGVLRRDATPDGLDRRLRHADVQRAPSGSTSPS